MVVRGCHICPATAGEGPEDAYSSDKLWKRSIWTTRKDVPERNQGESRT
jgi:hypothetical protein